MIFSPLFCDIPIQRILNTSVLQLKGVDRGLLGGSEGVQRGLPIATPSQPSGNPQATPSKVGTNDGEKKLIDVLLEIADRSYGWSKSFLYARTLKRSVHR
jgi:hypothetical protein